MIFPFRGFLLHADLTFPNTINRGVLLYKRALYILESTVYRLTFIRLSQRNHDLFSINEIYEHLVILYVIIFWEI